MRVTSTRVHAPGVVLVAATDEVKRTRLFSRNPNRPSKSFYDRRH